MKQFFTLALIITSLISHAQSPAEAVGKLGANPLFFIDSGRVEKDALGRYHPQQIASVSIYTDSTAVQLAGQEARDGVVYIETKAFCRTRYIRFFSAKSAEYAAIVNGAQKDSAVQYILNSKVLKENFEGDLSLIDDKVFKTIKLIDKDGLQKQFNITDKDYGILIESGIPEKLYNGQKKF